MSATFVGVDAAIKSKLNSLTGSGQVLSTNYDYHETTPSGFPAATFEASQLQNSMFTTNDNLRGYSFDIVIYQEFSTITRQEAKDILYQTADALVQAFDEDVTLGGVCDYTVPVQGNFGVYDAANGSMMYLMLTITAYSEVDVVP